VPITSYASVKRCILLATLLFALNLPAHTQQQPALEDVLAHLDENATAYVTSLPSFFAEETFVSQELRGDKLKQSVTTVSTFRVLRTPGNIRLPGKSNESREVHAFNGKPATGDHVKGPFTFTGGFDAALAMFRSSNALCFTFQLLPSPDAAHLLLAFIAKEPTGDCPARLAGETGTALLDAQTMQPIRIDRTIPHAQGVDHATLTWSVDFMPATLGERTFSMPANVRSQLTYDASDHLLRTNATYTNYHRLAVTATILPGDSRP
jgi:hypothetical protein